MLFSLCHLRGAQYIPLILLQCAPLLGKPTSTLPPIDFQWWNTSNIDTRTLNVPPPPQTPNHRTLEKMRQCTHMCPHTSDVTVSRLKSHKNILYINRITQIIHGNFLRVKFCQVSISNSLRKRPDFQPLKFCDRVSTSCDKDPPPTTHHPH